MLISTDSKIMFLGVPKTGTRTIESVTSKSAIKLCEHKNYPETIEIAKNTIQGFDESKVERVYLFWRDPVERFITSINHIRSKNFLTFALCYRPQWFPEADLSEYSINLPPMEKVPPFPKEIFQKIKLRGLSEYFIRTATEVTPEQIFSDLELMNSSVFLMKQSFWHQGILNDKKMVLDFANFKDNSRKIAVDFTSEDLDIPKLNETEKITTHLSPELEAAVKEYYAEDYDLRP